MSTPGRKRVQPLAIDDDDDAESSIHDAFISSASSLPGQAQDVTPTRVTFVPDPRPSLLKKNLYVPLNFDELSHIRNAQTNSEFAALLYDFKLYKSVVNGHICFSCRKVKFSLLQPGVRCAICLQRVCSRCQRKITCRQDRICFVSLNLLRRSSISLFPADMAMRRDDRTDSDSTTTPGKCRKWHQKKLAKNAFFSCCLDCFVLFDPASLV